MTVFAQFQHPRNGFLYIDPRDITGFRTNLEPDEVASRVKPLVVVMRSGANEEIVGLSMLQIMELRDLMGPLEKADPSVRFIPIDRLMAALAKTAPAAHDTGHTNGQRPTLHLKR